MALTHKQRFVKVLYERLGEVVGRRFAMGSLGHTLEQFGLASPALQESMGIGAATLIQAPQAFGLAIARFTGGDPNRINANLNEGVDEGVRTFLQTLQERRKRTPDYEPTDQDFDDAARTTVQRLVALEPDLSGLENRTVIVDGTQRVFHDEKCPICWKSTNVGGKKGEPRTERVTYQLGYRPVPLLWAVEAGYVRTSGSCCGQAVAEFMGRLRKAPSAMSPATEGLSSNMKNRYYRLLDEATEEQRKAIRAAGELPEWTVERLTDVLERSPDVPSFIRKLPKPPVKLAPLEQFAKLLDAASQSDVHLDRIRTHVDRFTRETNAGAAAQRQRINNLKAAFRR